MDASSNEQQNTVAKKSLPIVIFTVFIDLVGFSIVLPILAPLLALPFGSPILPNTPYDQRLIIFGFLVAAYAIAQFLATPIIGQLSDRYGRKPLLAISLIGTFLSRLLFIYAILKADIVLLFVSRIIDGITGGNISVAQSSIADVSTRENRAKNFGLLGAAFGLGFVLGPYIGGKLGDVNLVNSINDLFHTTFFTSSTLPLWFATILCLVNIGLVFTIFPETLKTKIHKKLSFVSSIKDVVKAFTVGNLRVVFLSSFFLYLGFSFFTQFFSVYVGVRFEPEALQTVQERFASGDLKVEAPDVLLQNVPESARAQVADAFVNQTNEVLKTITIKDLDSSTINYPESIEQIPDSTAKQRAEQLYSGSLGYVQGQVAAETQKRSADSFSYVGIWIALAQVIIVGQLSKKFKPGTLFKWGLVILTVAVFALLIPDKIIWLFLILPLVAIGNGLAGPNASAIISNSADEKSQGEVLGLNASIQSLAQALPSLVSGYLAGKLALNSPIIVGGLFFILAFAIMAFFFKEKDHSILHEE